MTTDPRRPSRLHTILCGIVLAAPLLFAAVVLVNPGTSIGAVIVFAMVVYALVLAGLHIALTSLALWLLGRFWPTLRRGAGVVMLTHLLGLPAALGLLAAWFAAEERGLVGLDAAWPDPGGRAIVAEPGPLARDLLC